MDNEHVWTFVEAIYRANFYTIRVLALDTIIADNECHNLLYCRKWGAILANVSLLSSAKYRAEISR